MQYPIWHNDALEKITCVEKIKVMEESLDELQNIAKDAFEDGILMGISEEQLRQCLVNLMLNLKTSY